MRRVRKAVFPVAGLGTRFLPATKITAKEMLPVVDKPLIQYAAEEAMAAGIDELIFVTGRTKRAIEDHFDRVPELELELESRNKRRELQQVSDMLRPAVTCISVRQAEPRGLGHAVLDSVGDGVIGQMCQAYEQVGCSLVAVERVPREETNKYGIVGVSDEQGSMARVDTIVEKPAPKNAPSDLAVVGRYVLTPDIFVALEKTEPGAGGEVQLTDAIARLVAGGEVRAYRFEGKRYDCGRKLGYLQATVELALKHPELGDAFRAYLDGLMGNSGS
jgi:UTP--glucose-1-phosphate uridylyltransferase